MIRKATKEDATCIAEMALMMWDSHSVEELAEEFETMLDNEECAVYLYYISQQPHSKLRGIKRDAQESCGVLTQNHNNMPIGFAQCGLRHDYVEGTESSPVGYLEGIFIREKYRKNGYAKDLLAECENWAKEKGCSEFASDCELDNDISLAFHMNMGFTEANRIICFTKQI